MSNCFYSRKFDIKAHPWIKDGWEILQPDPLAVSTVSGRSEWVGNRSSASLIRCLHNIYLHFKEVYLSLHFLMVFRYNKNSTPNWIALVTRVTLLSLLFHFMYNKSTREQATLVEWNYSSGVNFKRKYMQEVKVEGWKRIRTWASKIGRFLKKRGSIFRVFEIFRKPVFEFLLNLFLKPVLQNIFKLL